VRGLTMNKCSQFFSAFLTILLIATNFTSAETNKVVTLKIGQSAPDFNLPAVDGRNYKLTDFDAADILVVIFTCNHCPTAQAYEQRIKRLAIDYKPKGVAVVAISPNDPNAVRLDELGYSDLSDSLEEMKIRARDQKFKFPYLYDGYEQKVSRTYGPTATPHVFIFDKQRKLRYVGRIDDSEKPEQVKSHDTRNAIEALLAGREVPVGKTKTFGCSIKWSDKSQSVDNSLKAWAKEPVKLDMISAADLKELVRNNSGKLRLINVWATWCGPCVAEFPELVTIHRMYRNRDFELITISADAPERKDGTLSFLKKHQASCRNYLYNSKNRYALMEAVDMRSPGGIPYTIIAKPGGEIIYRHLGMINPLEVKKVIVGYLGRTYN
jgi:thiol-disulfide isomerase/thioredoxin